mgnify:CR=1 FL=1
MPELTIPLRSHEEAILVLGPYDRYARLLRQDLDIEIYARAGNLRLKGADDGIRAASERIEHLLGKARKGRDLSVREIEGILLDRTPVTAETAPAGGERRGPGREVSSASSAGSKWRSGQRPAVVRFRPRPVEPRSENQRRYVEAIEKNDLVFGLGPAGTGKTYLAVAAAVQRLRRGKVRRLIITRPVVEAGEHLGFLPGDLQQKLNPYLRPIYDALRDMIEPDDLTRMEEAGIIEIETPHLKTTYVPQRFSGGNRIPILISAPGVKAGTSTQQLTESVDIYPTIAQLAGLPKPQVPQPIDGVSLVPVLQNPKARVRDHAYHAYPRGKLGRAIRTDRYRLVQWRSLRNASQPVELELYDYANDSVERRNLAAEKPEILKELLNKLEQYPTPVGASWDQQDHSRIQIPTPQIANKSIRIIAEVEVHKPKGVVVAQGGREHGYALHFVGGRPAFDVRVNGKVHRLMAKLSQKWTLKLEASFDADSMKLGVNGKFTQSKSPGLIPVQPKDGLDVGFDDQSAAGDYAAPNPFNATILSAKVKTGLRD